MQIVVKSYGMELTKLSDCLSKMNHEELSNFFWNEVGTSSSQYGTDKRKAIENFYDKFQGNNWESLTKVQIVSLGNKATDSNREYIVIDTEHDGELTYLDLN